MKLSLSIILFTALLATGLPSLACKPAPPENTNWLRFNVEFDASSFLPGLSASARGTQVTFKSKPGVTAQYLGQDWANPGKKKWDELPEFSHITDVAGVRLEEGSSPTFNAIKPREKIPKPQSFDVVVSIDERQHAIKGRIIYSRNPSYDPDAIKKWVNPCANFDKIKKVPGS